MGGNETFVRARIGKSDANRGFVFLNDGKGKFTYLPQYKSGLDLDGDVRQLLFIPSKDRTHLIVGEIGQAIKDYTLATDKVTDSAKASSVKKASPVKKASSARQESGNKENPIAP
jgi:hypothetical protein